MQLPALFLRTRKTKNGEHYRVEKFQITPLSILRTSFHGPFTRLVLIAITLI